MANTILSPSTILREAGRLFHQKARFIGSIDRQYDARFKERGAKRGDTIALRDPVEFDVTDGRIMNIQDVEEVSQNLTVGTQKHVAFKFNAVDLSLKIDDFSERYLNKAVARLAAACESEVLAHCRKRTALLIDSDAAAFSFLDVAKAKQKLDEHLADADDSRVLLLNPTHSTKYLDATKGLFTPQGKLGAQYGDGMVKDALGFNIMSSTFLSDLTTGTAAKTTGYLANNAVAQIGASIIVDTGTTTFLEGDMVTFAGSNDVHPETKDDLGYLKQFTITANSGASATSLAISPSVIATGPRRNVSQAIADNSAVVKLGAGAGEKLVESLAYHPDAFVFATADLEDPSKYRQWGAVREMDSISMRVWRSADIVNDEFPTRIDIFYGRLARYASKMAVRIHADA